jgi:cytochrome c biogenesis protein CcdA/glutaredoxin-related protein
VELHQVVVTRYLKMMRRKIFILLTLVILICSLASAEDVCSVNADDESCVSEEEKSSDIQAEGYIEHSENQICIIYFYGEGCPKCAQLEPYLKRLERKYRDKISITKYELYHNLKNYHLYNEYCNIQNIPVEERGVPFVAIDREYYMGLNQIKTRLEPKIEELLKSGERICPLEGERACHLIEKDKGDISPLIPSLKSRVSMPLIIVTGLIDGINPCAFAVLIFLLTFLLSISSTKKRMIKAGIVYIIAVYISYFLAGIGLLSAIQLTGISRIIVKVAALFAIFAGIMNIKDYFWYGKGFSLKIPDSKKKVIEKWTHKANVPAAIVLGFLVSMFELPCTGGVYLAIVAMLANSVTRLKALWYLLIYNIMFIVPLVIILILVIVGMKAEHIENWRDSHKNIMRLILGILLLILGIALLLGWI